VQERRKSGRARVLKGAKLVVGKASILDCVVRNLNNVGARVELTNSASVPENAQLTFDGGIVPAVPNRLAEIRGRGFGF
jgi:hypothetical protein